MSQRIEKTRIVFVSVENPEHDRCVDMFSRPDSSYGFEEFRRDIEDSGQWTPVQYYLASLMVRQSTHWTPPNDVFPGWPISSCRNQN